MLVIAPVDRRVQKQPHPSDKTTSTSVEYIDDTEPVSVKSSQYYRRKIADGKLILVSESETPPNGWVDVLHPVQQKRCIAKAKIRVKEEMAAKKAKKAKEAQVKEAQVKKAQVKKAKEAQVKKK